MKSFISFTTIILLASLGYCGRVEAQLMQEKEQYTHADTLRGSDNANRNWWNVLRYEITVKPDYNAKSIQGITKIVYSVDKNILKRSSHYQPTAMLKIYFREMQIDLQAPMIIDSVLKHNQ